MEILQTKVRRDLVAAWTYSKEAYHLLRRHPSLLLLPLLVAVFNSVERGVGTYLSSTRTEYGRQLLERRQEEARRYPRPAMTPWQQVSMEVTSPPLPGRAFRRGAGMLMSGSELRPTLTGTGRVIFNETYPRSKFLLMLSVVAMSVVMLFAGAVVMAGYLGVVHRTMASGHVGWEAFWREGYALGPRMLVYFIAAAVPYLPGAVATAIPLFQGAFVFPIVMNWLGPLLGLFLCLTPMFIVADRERIGPALGRSLRAVWSKYVTALALGVGASLLYVIPLVMYRVGKALVSPSYRVGVQPEEGLWMIPLDAALEVVAAVIGTWLVLALFCWRREEVTAERPLDTEVRGESLPYQAGEESGLTPAEGGE